MEITVFGTFLIILGYLGVFAGLLTLAVVTSKRETPRNRPVLRIRNAAVVTFASILLTTLGFVISDPRRISDSLALLFLAGGLVAIIAMLMLMAALGARGEHHKAWAVVTVSAGALLAIFAVWLGLTTGDFTTSLILSSFVLPTLAAIVALTWLLVTVILRRGRGNAATFVGSAASLAVMGLFAVTILTIPDRLVDTSREASLSSVFPPANGWSSEQLGNAFNFAQDLGSSSVIVVSKGQLVAEWGVTNKRISAHSVRKSIVSALYGIAVERGLIDTQSTLEELGIDDQNPPLSPVEKQARLVDLLMSRSGIYHDSVRDDVGGGRPERGSHPPGTFFYYNNWSFNALGSIFEQKIGLSLGEAFKQWIAEPTGMQDFRPKDVKYESSSGSIHPAYRFWMTARDLTRLGVLFQQQGRWNDRQIISPEWIDESTATYSDRGNGFGYGYMWWTKVSLPFWSSDGAYFASGTGGQVIFVDPDRKLVIVHRTDTGKGLTRALWWDYGRSVTTRKFMELASMIVSASPERR